MIDTHAHLYLPEFDHDREQLVQNARKERIEKILLPAIDSTTHLAMLKVEEEFPECVSMIGLHPCSVKEEYEDEMEVITGYLKRRNFVAIGEIGLDFYWDTTFRDQQYDAFHRQIKIAIEYDLPIVIHSRNAIDECIEVVAQYPDAKGVFHCFSGNEQQARKIIELKFKLGIGGVATFKNAGLDKVMQQIGITDVILETDAPYLAPVPYRGKRNEPAYIRLVVEKLADITGIGRDVIEQLTTANAKKLFNLK